MALLIRPLALLVMILVLAASLPAQAGTEELRLQEQEIEAGLLYNFLKYIEWPAGSTAGISAVSVCLFGPDPFGGYLQPMAGRTVNQRPIAIRSIRDVNEAGACQLVFVNAGEKTRWPQLLEFLAGKGVLTVGDFPEFARSGGMIEFGRKDDHISVQLNVDSLKAAQLRVEDRLLKLVTIVHSGEP